MTTPNTQRRRLFQLTGAALLTQAVAQGGLLSLMTSPAWAADRPLRVVTTIYPPFDFVRQIAGNAVEPILLLKPGQEAHTYEPSPKDIKTIESADLFIYVGGENDAWVEGLLDSLGDKSPQTVRLVDLVATVAEDALETVDGDKDEHDHDEKSEGAHDHDHDHAEHDHAHGDAKTAENDHDHEHDHDHGHDHGHDHHGHSHDEPVRDDVAQLVTNANRTIEEKMAKEAEVEAVADSDHHAERTSDQEAASKEAHEDDELPSDEHVWTSPKNAMDIVDGLTEILSNLDAKDKATFEKNAAAYKKELAGLDEAFRQVVSTAKRRTILVADRFPFRYFADAYGLTYFAAFPGCSTQVRPSAATVAFLVDKTRELKLPVVLNVANNSPRIANTVAEGSGAKILSLNAIHNLTPQEYAAGETYLSLMRKNVEILRQALN